MTKLRVYGKNFGKVCCIYIVNGSSVKENIHKIIKIFDSKYGLISIVAMDKDSDFFNQVLCKESKDNVIFPQKDTITAETKFITGSQDIPTFLELLLNCSQSCITFYGVASNHNARNLALEKNIRCQDRWIVDKNIEYKIAVVLEEDIIEVSFNKLWFDAKSIIAQIKEMFLGK